MAFTHIASIHKDGDSTSSTNWTHGLTVQSGDLLVCYINRNGDVAISNNDGTNDWTEVINETPTSETAKHALFYRISNGSEPTVYDFDLSTIDRFSVGIKQFRPSGTVGIALAGLSSRNTNSSYDIECDAIVGRTIPTGSLSIVAGGKDRSQGDLVWTGVDSGYSDLLGRGAYQSFGMAHKILTSEETPVSNVTFTADSSIGSDATYNVHIAFSDTVGGDVTPPVFTSAPSVTNTTTTGHTVTATLNENGTIYGVRLANGATAPTSAQVKAGTDASDVAAPEAKSAAAIASSSQDLVFSTGSAATDYDYYIVAEDDEGSPNLQATPTLVEATTSAGADVTPPTFSVAPAVTTITSQGATATATINETGDIYYVVVADGDTAPSVDEVIAGQSAGGGSPLASGSATGTTTLSSPFNGLLSSTAYDVYYSAQDDEGTPNKQASVTKVDFTTGAAGAVPTAIARYLFDEASSGTTPTQVFDTTGNSNHLSINYGTNGGLWTSDAQGNGFEFPLNPGSGSAANLSISDLSGTEFTTYNAATEASFIMVVDLDDGMADSSRLFQIGTTSGDGSFALSDNGSTIRIRWAEDTGETGDSVNYPSIEGVGKRIIHGIVDSTEAVGADRCKMYVNNVLQTASEGVIPLNAAPIVDATRSLEVGNRGDGIRSIDGKIYFLAFYDRALTPQEVSESYTALLTNHDADPLAEPDTTAPIISSPTATETGDTTASGTVSTDEGNGTLYYIATANATENATTVKTGSTQAVSQTGVQNVTVTGLTASTSYYVHYLHRDAAGNDSNVESSAQFTTTAPQLSIDSMTAAPIYVGDTVTLNLSNASASGKTLELNDQSHTIDSQDASTVVFTAPDPKTFGDKTLPYSADITAKVVDGAEEDTITFQIAPAVGDYYVASITSANTGIYANDTGVQVGDSAYGTWVSGSGLAFLENGAVSSTEGTFRYWLKDVGTGVWSDSADELFNPTPNNPATGYPVITGSPMEGQTLGVNTDDIDDLDGLGAFSYQWIRDDVNIGGATSSTYLLTQADVGSVIKVNVSFTDGTGTAESITSAGTVAILNLNQAPTGTVTIDNTTPVIGNTLTASNDLADQDGLGAITYQWRRSGEDISGATGTTYVVTVTDASHTISVVASYTDQQGTQESVASSETSAVPLPPDTTAPVITLNGPSTVYVAQDSTYTDQGAIAIDDRDGNITDDIVPTSNVNTAVLGTYTVTYNVDDAAGNSATPVVRTVEVVEFSTTPEASNEQAVAFFRAETGLNTYNINELAIAYYKQVTGSVLGSFNDLHKGAATLAGFQGYSPADYRNYI